MIVRESPSPAKPQQNAQWPPRSPHAALVASPSGRKRLEKYYSPRRSPTPSPRRPRSRAPARSDSGEEDEETLQLQLEEIKTRLKLKKLRKEKASSAVAEEVVVPSSPKQKLVAPTPKESPKRIQLGIDKGVKATDVSLRRAKSTSDAAYSRKARNQSHMKPAVKISSYSERMAQTRDSDEAKSIKQQRSQDSRSNGFGVKKSSRAPEGIIAEKPAEGFRPPAIRTEAAADLDTFSGLSLSRRLIDTSQLKEALDGKVSYSIPKLLKEVVAPDYDPPDIEDDYVVFGVIASKSTPRNHAPSHRTSSTADPDDSTASAQKSKFMAIKLTDLTWEIDLFLFGSGFDTFYKLTIGTVIAVLNPGIMPPKPHMKDSGSFNLKLGSSDDTVLEIGTAKDLGFCKSIKKDGKQCDTWINLQKTEYCDFHINLQVERTRASRMEINSMTSFDMFKKPGAKGPGRANPGKAPGRGTGASTTRGPKSMGNGAYYDREAHSAAFAIPAHLQHGSSAVQMLDAEDYTAHGGTSAADRSRKRLAAQQKERDLARKLGAQGSGIGKEYMQSSRHEKSSKEASHTKAQEDGTPDALALDLVGSSAPNLGPSSGAPARPSKKGSEGVGWSSAFKRGLPSPTRSPSPKKARFQIEGKGVRVPGRPSLPSAAAAIGDDDLDIV